MENIKNVIEEMKQHGMRIPPDCVKINIPDARMALVNNMQYFLGMKQEIPVWIPAYEEVASWLENNQGRGLFLHGGCGLGKSLLSCYVIPAILLTYARKVVNVYDMQDVNKDIDGVLAKKIISIDDVGTESNSVNFGNKRIAFEEIMDSAEKTGKLVIATTNLSGVKIAERYGERVLDRIISTTKRIEFKGDSFRK